MAKKQEIRAPVGEICELPLDKIDPFPEHPYKVVDDDDMDQLVESIRAKGIISPCIVRKTTHGRYELVSGHRRMHACKRLGMDTLRCEVLDITKEEATVLMVESNFQRDKLLPSEKAFAYKMRLEAMKLQISRMKTRKNSGLTNYAGESIDSQLDKAEKHLGNAYGLTEDELSVIGTRAIRKNAHQVPAGYLDAGKKESSNNGAPVGPESNRVRDRLAAVSSDSREQIRRFIRLTELIPELLDMVDEGKIGLRTAVELSYLELFQRDVYKQINMSESYPTMAQAIRMRRMYEGGKLTPKLVEKIMTEAKPNQKERFSMSSEKIMKWIPEGMSRKQAERYVENALEHYARYLERKEKSWER